jgi:hypothetical protein
MKNSPKSNLLAFNVLTKFNSPSQDGGSTRKIFIYKRHDKSLYELSRKFLLKHWNLKEYIINLENLTHELGKFY